jgi:hypothetical protein
MLVVIRYYKSKPKSLFTMIRMTQNGREWEVNNQDIFHIIIVSLKFHL